MEESVPQGLTVRVTERLHRKKQGMVQFWDRHDNVVNVTVNSVPCCTVKGKGADEFMGSEGHGFGF